MAETYFDTETGAVFSSLVDASNNPDVTLECMNFSDLLTVRHFPYRLGDFAPITPNTPRREHALMLGRWALDELSKADLTRPITQKVMRRMAILGMCDVMDCYRADFPNFSAFKEEVGSPIRYDRVKFAGWNLDRCLEYLESFGHKVTLQDIEEGFTSGKGPARKFLDTTVGNLGAINDYLGYPHTRGMDKEDKLIWGIKALRANPHINFTQYIPMVLCARERSPSVSALARSAGSWGNYQKMVIRHNYNLTRRNEEERPKRLELYRAWTRTGRIPEKYLDLDDMTLLEIGGRLAVTDACNIHLNKKQLGHVTNPEQDFTKTLRKFYPWLAPSVIERYAWNLALYDDIWPNPDSLRHFMVSHEEVGLLQTYQRNRTKAHRQADRATKQKAA